MYRYIIIDNEQLSINILENHLNTNSELTNVGFFSSPFEAFDMIKNGEVDLVFISFSSSPSNIIDIIKAVNLDTLPLFVVMSTNKMDIFRINSTFNVVDFLEVPINFQKLSQSLRKVDYILSLRKELNVNSGNGYIFIKVDRKKVRLNFEDILYIESVKDYVNVITKDDIFRVYSTLTNFTKQLPSDTFLRTHRSYTVSLIKIISIEGHIMEIGKEKIPFSKKYLDIIKDRLFIDK